jgi:hypothetical protein
VISSPATPSALKAASKSSASPNTDARLPGISSHHPWREAVVAQHRAVISRGCAKKADPDYPISAKAPAGIADLPADASIAGRKPRIGAHRLTSLRRVPHQPGVEGLGCDHGQDYDGAEGEGAGAGLDRDDGAKCDQRAEPIDLCNAVVDEVSKELEGI